MDYIPGLYDYVFNSLAPSWARPIHNFFSTFSALVLPLIDRLITSPDLASVALLLIILWISMKILGMVYRAVMFWVMLFFRIIFWGSLIAGLLYTWNRGPDGVVQDLSAAYGVWMGEYQYWREQQNIPPTFRPQAGYKARSGGAGWAR